MKRIMIILVAAVSALALCSCGSSAQPKRKSSKKKMDVPVWFNVLPQEENALFAAHSATKSSMALALDFMEVPGATPKKPFSGLMA